MKSTRVDQKKYRSIKEIEPLLLAKALDSATRIDERIMSRVPYQRGYRGL